jgi:hypothetical protein
MEGEEVSILSELAVDDRTMPRSPQRRSVGTMKKKKDEESLWLMELARPRATFSQSVHQCVANESLCTQSELPSDRRNQCYR